MLPSSGPNASQDDVAAARMNTALVENEEMEDGDSVELGSRITGFGEESASASISNQSSHYDVMLLPEQKEEIRVRLTGSESNHSGKQSGTGIQDGSTILSNGGVERNPASNTTDRVSSSSSGIQSTGSNAVVGAELASGGFEGDFDEPFWEKVAVKVSLEGQPQQAALQETRVDRIVEEHGSVDKALLWVLKECPMQGETIRMLSGMLPRGVDLKDREALEETGETALHSAAERNFYHVVHGLLIYDSEAPVERKDAHGKVPVEIAMDSGYDKLAALLVKSMSKSSVRALFEAGEDGIPKHSFQDLVKKGDMSETCQEVMNACIEPTGEPDELRFHFNILEADRHGNTPDDKEFAFESSTAYHRAVESDDKAVRQHALIRMLTYDKWTSYGEHLALLKLALYLAFLFVISFSLISAAKQANPASYNSHEDNARAFFEVVSILFLTYQIVEGVRQFRQIRFDYFKSGWNNLHVLSWLLFVVLIPLRFTEVSGQWHVASILFALLWIRLLELMSVTRFVGIYMQMLARILVKDVSRFLVVFLSILIAYAGSLVLALRGEKWTGSLTPEENRTVPEETTELGITRLTNSFGSALLTGFRSMVQQESLVDYVDSSGTEASFSWLAIIINIVFLFFLLVVLLNILIAQLSDTYAEVQGDAQHELEQNWADAIKVQEQGGGGMMERFRFKSFKSFSDILEPGDLIIAWESAVTPTTTTACSGGSGGGGGGGGPSAEEKADIERRQVKMGAQIERASAKIESLSFQVKMIVDILRKMEEETQPRLQKTITHFQEDVLTDCMENIVKKSTDLMSTQVKKLEENTTTQMDTLGNTLSPEHVQTIVQDTVQANLRPLYEILQRQQEWLVDMPTRAEVEEMLRQQPRESPAHVPRRRTLLDQLLGVPPTADDHRHSADLDVVETTPATEFSTDVTDGQVTTVVPARTDATPPSSARGDVATPLSKHGTETEQPVAAAAGHQEDRDSTVTTGSASMLDRLYAAVGNTDLLGTSGRRTSTRQSQPSLAGRPDMAATQQQTREPSAGADTTRSGRGASGSLRDVGTGAVLASAVASETTTGSQRLIPSPAMSETSWVLFNDDLQEYRVMNPANMDAENVPAGSQQHFATTAANATQQGGQFAADVANAEEGEEEQASHSSDLRDDITRDLRDDITSDLRDDITDTNVQVDDGTGHVIATASDAATPLHPVTMDTGHAESSSSMTTSQQSDTSGGTEETDSRTSTPVPSGPSPGIIPADR